MNLVAITALIAVCGAAKLDRTYLPPASAKTAGGGAGLQTPFATNSLNNGLGGLPTGSYTNEFQGVVVDAAAAGTRIAGTADTGLGAPRISYGSSDSKVGAAAFKVNQAGFRQPTDAAQAGFDGQNVEGQQNFQSFQQAQTFSNSERPRVALDRSASTVRFENEVGPESFNYAFETDNGIVAEERGVATNGVQAQGAFSYTGDDGQVYSVTYTADEDGYQPKGDHLPTPPPIPEEILKSLEQNAREEAAGLVDDGSYDAQKYNAGSDYAESDSTNGKYNHQSSLGNRPEADATASGTFISQNNQLFGRPSGISGNSRPTSFGMAGNGASNGLSHSGPSSSGQGHDAFNRFSEQTGQGASNGFGSSSNVLSGQSGNSFNGKKEQNGKDASNGFAEQTENNASSGFGFSSTGLSGQTGGFRGQDLPTAQSSKRPLSHFEQSPINILPAHGQGNFNGQSGISGDSSSDAGSSPTNNAFGASSSAATNLAAGLPSQGNMFGNKNEYLPPVSFSQNIRPQSTRPQGEAVIPENSAQYEQEYNTGTQSSANFQPQPNKQGQSRPQGTSRPTFGRPSSNRVFGQSADVTAQATNNIFRPSNGVNDFAQSGQSSEGSFASTNEYLPPANKFIQNGRPPQNQPGRPNVPSANSQLSQNLNSNSQTFGNVQSHFPNAQNQGRPQSPSALAISSSGSQPAFGTQSPQHVNGFQRPQSSSNGKPNYQNGNNRFPSQVNSQTQLGFVASSANVVSQLPTQSTSRVTSLNSQLSTTQPDTELTTPIESNSQPKRPDAIASQTTSDFTFSGFQSSNKRPTQPQFGTQFGNISPNPTQSSTLTFPSRNTLSTTRPQGPNSQPLGQTQNVFSGQSSQGQSNQQSQIGNSQLQPTQTAFSQTPEDVQYSSSTQKSTYSQQTQGTDDSYYYNQPSKPFGTPSQASRFPNAPSDQFDRVTQQPSLSQSNSQFASSLQNVPSASVSSQSKTPQGSIQYPRPPTLAPVVPTSSTQGTTFPSSFSGITQASISPFPSQTPTQSNQFLTQQVQFGSKPDLQQSLNKFNQGSPQSTPTFGQQSASPQPGFNDQTTAAPQLFPQRLGVGNAFQSQTQFSQQQSLNQNQPQQTKDTSVQSAMNQQYNGEIYEYNKPAESLPEHKVGQGTGQFGQKVQSKPELAENSKGSTTPSKFGFQQTSQTSQGSRPQFGGLPSKPAFNFNAQSQESNFGMQPSSQEQSPQESRPQFGLQPSRASNGQTAQNIQEHDSEDNQSQTIQNSRPQFGVPCCKQLPQFGSVKPTQGSLMKQTGQPTQNFGTSTQNRFGTQDSGFNSAQSFNPEEVKSNFAGKGEIFGGPRKPPSFDEQTGYHY